MLFRIVGDLISRRIPEADTADVILVVEIIALKITPELDGRDNIGFPSIAVAAYPMRVVTSEKSLLHSEPHGHRS